MDAVAHASQPVKRENGFRTGWKYLTKTLDVSEYGARMFQYGFLISMALTGETTFRFQGRVYDIRRLQAILGAYRTAVFSFGVVQDVEKYFAGDAFKKPFIGIQLYRNLAGLVLNASTCAHFMNSFTPYKLGRHLATCEMVMDRSWIAFSVLNVLSQDGDTPDKTHYGELQKWTGLAHCLIQLELIQSTGLDPILLKGAAGVGSGLFGIIGEVFG